MTSDGQNLPLNVENGSFIFVILHGNGLLNLFLFGFLHNMKRKLHLDDLLFIQYRTSSEQVPGNIFVFLCIFNHYIVYGT